MIHPYMLASGVRYSAVVNPGKEKISHSSPTIGMLTFIYLVDSAQKIACVGADSSRIIE